MHAPDPHAPDPHAPTSHVPEHDDPDLDALMQDKLEAHCRQQLSALVDGALPPDEARFLLRRLRHDRELAGRWERWQVYGELMRGGVSQLLPADFSQRVCAALEEEARAQPLPAVAARGTRPAWTRWAGGAALAASVAMAALVVVQRDPQGRDLEPGGSGLQVASTASPSAPLLPASQQAASPRTSADGAAQTQAGSAVAAGALLLAARDVPRRLAARPGNSRNGNTQMRGATAPGDARLQAVATAAASLPAADPRHAQRDPFVMDVAADARPWPRAVLPGMAQGGFSVGYGATSTEAGAFEYFEPRLPIADGVQSNASLQAEAGPDR